MYPYAAGVREHVDLESKYGVVNFARVDHLRSTCACATRCVLANEVCIYACGYRLFINQFASAQLKRNMRAQQYKENKRTHYNDRRVYWVVRAEAMCVPLLCAS